MNNIRQKLFSIFTAAVMLPFTLFVLTIVAVPKVTLAATEFTITKHQIEESFSNKISMVIEMSVTNTGPGAIEAIQIHPAGCDGCGVYVGTLAAGQTATYMGDVVAPAAQYNAADPRLGLSWQITDLNAQ